MSIITPSTPVSVAGTSITLPAHQPGDGIFIWATQITIAAPPSKPAAGGTVPTWTDIDPSVTSANLAGGRTAYCVATASNHTSGIWTSAHCLAVIVLRGIAIVPIGAHGVDNQDGTRSPNAPTVIMTKTNGTSVLLHLLGAYNLVNTFWAAAPAGYTTRTSVISAGNAGVLLDTKNVTTSDGSLTHSDAYDGSTAGLGATIEVLAAPDTGGFFAMF